EFVNDTHALARLGPLRLCHAQETIAGGLELAGDATLDPFNLDVRNVYVTSHLFASVPPTSSTLLLCSTLKSMGLWLKLFDCPAEQSACIAASGMSETSASI